jgi:hypothetical protein
MVVDRYWGTRRAESTSLSWNARRTDRYRLAPKFVGGAFSENSTVMHHGCDGAYPENEQLSGGFTILELPLRDAAEEWAARFAVTCRCPQELREFMYDPES